MSAKPISKSAGTTNAADSVTLVIHQRVRADAVTHYEQWLRVISATAAEYPGHRGVHVIRPPAGSNEYAILLRFATLADAERWTKSADRQRLLAEITDAFELEDRFRIEPGIDFLFAPPTPAQKRPSAWKQWLITTSVIWPLTMFVPPIFHPLFVAVPLLEHWGIRQGIIASAIVALVVFVIMPRYVRAVSGWLYR